MDQLTESTPYPTSRIPRIWIKIGVPQPSFDAAIVWPIETVIIAEPLLCHIFGKCLSARHFRHFRCLRVSLSRECAAASFPARFSSSSKSLHCRFATVCKVTSSYFRKLEIYEIEWKGRRKVPAVERASMPDRAGKLEMMRYKIILHKEKGPLKGFPFRQQSPVWREHSRYEDWRFSPRYSWYARKWKWLFIVSFIYIICTVLK